ncbi:MAG: secondary thiamine-phosphate synthase enzyme YjbQ [Kiritimatiellia bacterium]
MKTITVQTSAHAQMVDITRNVTEVLAEMGVEDGIVTIFTPHTTCGLTINENTDPHVTRDLLKQLDEMVPWRQPFYLHSEGNSAAHIKASMIGSSLTLIAEWGALRLGQWQGIYLCEFDGPRTRSVYVK